MCQNGTAAHCWNWDLPTTLPFDTLRHLRKPSFFLMMKAPGSGKLLSQSFLNENGSPILLKSLEARTVTEAIDPLYDKCIWFDEFQHRSRPEEKESIKWSGPKYCVDRTEISREVGQVVKHVDTRELWCSVWDEALHGVDDQGGSKEQGDPGTCDILCLYTTSLFIEAMHRVAHYKLHLDIAPVRLFLAQPILITEAMLVPLYIILREKTRLMHG